eukprot:4434648-Amphidinium_carterae.1
MKMPSAYYSPSTFLSPQKIGHLQDSSTATATRLHPTAHEPQKAGCSAHNRTPKNTPKIKYQRNK